MRIRGLAMIIMMLLMAAYPRFAGGIHASTTALTMKYRGPQLVRRNGVVYVQQDQKYHRIPNPALAAAMGVRPDQARSEAKLSLPVGHPLTFVYDPSVRIGYWFHRGKLYPVKSYAPSDWQRWGHLVRYLPFPRSHFWVRLSRSGMRSMALLPAPGAFRSFDYQGLVVDYPASWKIQLTSKPSLQVTSLGRNHTPMQVLLHVQFLALPQSAMTHSTAKGVTFAAFTARRAGRVVVSRQVAFGRSGGVVRLRLTVPLTLAKWARSFLDRWQVHLGSTKTAHLSGTSNQQGSPIVPVTLVGPKAAVNSWAEIDTGNQSATLVTPAVARAIGLKSLGSQISCGVQDCAMEMEYGGLSVAPKGTADWMQWAGKAVRWQGSGGVTVDLGTTFLKKARLSLNGGRWRLAWPVARANVPGAGT